MGRRGAAGVGSAVVEDDTALVVAAWTIQAPPRVATRLAGPAGGQEPTLDPHDGGLGAHLCRRHTRVLSMGRRGAAGVAIAVVKDETALVVAALTITAPPSVATRLAGPAGGHAQLSGVTMAEVRAVAPIVGV